MTFTHARMFPIAHRERIMAKRELYGKLRATQRPFGLIELFTTEERRKFRLPHQGTKECAKRLRSLSA